MELMTCEITGFLNKAFLPFLLIALILSSSFSIRSGICEEIRDNKALDEKVEKFLETRKGTWHDWNIPYSDGKVLYDLVLNHGLQESVGNRNLNRTLSDLDSMGSEQNGGKTHNNRN